MIPVPGAGDSLFWGKSQFFVEIGAVPPFSPNSGDLHLKPMEFGEFRTSGVPACQPFINLTFSTYF